MLKSFKINLTIKNYQLSPKRIDKWIDEALNLYNDNSLPSHYKFSRTKIKNLILDGKVIVDNKIISDPSVKITNEKTITIFVPEPIDPNPKPEDIDINIKYEDEHILIVDKQANLVVHPAPGNETGTLVNAILYHCKNKLSGIGGVKRPGIVHRLDKDTSGLMVVAKTEKAHLTLVQMFQGHDLERKYKALVWNIPQTIGLIDKPISRSNINRKKMAISLKGKPALTKWKLIEIFSNMFSLIECELKTGRTHQIRVHMSHLGHNIVGDKLYFKKHKTKNITNESLKHKIIIANSFGRQALHSSKIGFFHPINKNYMEFESKLPEDIRKLIINLT